MVMGKGPTEVLREEHENVQRKLDALEEVLHHLEQREAISAKLEELASFFKTDFWTHFAKEEEALFPELEKFLPRQGGPTGVMLTEHEELRKTNTELQRGVEAYLRDSTDAEVRRTIQGQGAYFIQVLRDHIDKENNILFMMANMHLTPAQKEKILKLFGEIEKNRERGN